MVISLLVLFTPPVPALFIGNSHTSLHDVPAMVRNLLVQPRIEPSLRFASFLNEHASDPAFLRDLERGRWKIVVLQSAKMSSSHRYVYSQEGAHQVSDAAKRGGARMVFFPEWPRRGWKETDYILGVYRPLAKRVDAALAPVPQAWDIALGKKPNLVLWAEDGNHSSLDGAYLAACVLATRLGKIGDWAPKGLDPRQASFLRSVARTAVADEKKGVRASSSNPLGSLSS